jgi:hypothetical protein
MLIFPGWKAKFLQPLSPSLRLRTFFCGISFFPIHLCKPTTGDQVSMAGESCIVPRSASKLTRCYTRIVLYPGRQEIIDYFKWRQADSKPSFIPCSV